MCFFFKRPASEKMQDKFSNARIQSLYNFSNRNFSEEFYLEWESGLDKEFAGLIDRAHEADWNYFEETIHRWDSLNLYILADCLAISSPIDYQLDYRYFKRIYCFAFIYCDVEDSERLRDNLPAELGMIVDLDVELLDQVIAKLEILKESTMIKQSDDWEENVKSTIEFVKEKRSLTKNHLREN